ncbi:Gfo/Idh/MocA family protein [Gorillibacterium sp. sgz5001074]|uniref:Gfo/Idh/MocA family protein n=1 Tax=Gorillibacterium sp. sgz5001074 TaxID=3446695 RepID=UPI003F67D44B
MKRFILVGHGTISAKYTAAIARFQDRAEIVGVVGRNPGKCEAYAREHGIPVWGTDLKEVAARSEATAAVICTPNALHYEGVMQASSLGLHCLCEKPLHIEPARQEEMIASCKQHGVMLAVSYMRRFIPHIRQIKAWMDEGRLGRITVVDAMMKHYRTKEYYDSWHGTWALDGGGPFIQQGSHLLDMVLWLAGGCEEVLEARTFRVYHDIETEDHGYAMLRYGNGAVGMIEASTASVGMKKEYVEITGTLGSVTADYEGILSLDIPGLELPEAPPVENDGLFVSLVEDFLEALDTGRDPFITGESASRATELALAIYAKAGPPVTVR